VRTGRSNRHIVLPAKTAEGHFHDDTAKNVLKMIALPFKTVSSQQTMDKRGNASRATLYLPQKKGIIFTENKK